MNTIVKFDNFEQWLQARKEGLGGTDISAIIGVNKYKTAFDVWEDKTGRGEDFAGNKFTKAGHFLEEAVANYFEDETGHKVIKASAIEELYINKDYNYLLGSPDRRFFHKDGGKGVLECKTTQRSIEPNIDEIPKEWFCQIQWYLGLTGLEKGFIAWLERGVDFKILEVNFVPDFYEFMISEGVAFWNEHIKKDVSPALQNSSDVLKALSPDAEKIAEGDLSLFNIREDLVVLSKQKKEIEEQIKEKQEAVKMSMLDAGVLSYAGDVLFTWKQNKDGQKFDDKALKASHPEIYNQFLVKKPGARILRIK